MAGYDDYQTEEEYIAASKRRWESEMDTKELKPVAWMDDGSLRAGSHGVVFRVVTDETKRDMPNSVAVSFTIPLYTADAIERLERERDNISKSAGQWEDMHRELFDAVMACADPEYGICGLNPGPERDALESVIKAHKGAHAKDGPYASSVSRLAAESELTTLRARVARLEEALEPMPFLWLRYGALARSVGDKLAIDMSIKGTTYEATITVCDLRRMLAALTEEQKP